MKRSECIKGMLITSRNGRIFGELFDTSTRGTVVIESYFDDCKHYIMQNRILPLEIVIEPDNGQFHAWAPALKGCHTCGDTEEEAMSNLKDAVRVYVHSMRKAGELKRWNGQE